MFKVNNKETIHCIVNFEQCLTPCSSVSTVNFELVNADWGAFKRKVSKINLWI